MNKKFSTLMAGFLLTSAFASAATPFHLSNKLKKVDEVKPGSSYFIVLDNDNNQKIDDKDQILSVVKNGSALDYKAYYVDIVFGKLGAGIFDALIGFFGADHRSGFGSAPLNVCLYAVKPLDNDRQLLKFDDLQCGILCHIALSFQFLNTT